jgi:hypothetical protein
MSLSFLLIFFARAAVKTNGLAASFVIGRYCIVAVL